MARVVDLTDQRFERFVVIKRASNDRHGKARWECLCDCGQTKTVGGAELRKRDTKSCGCFNEENLLTVNKTHGMSRSPEYAIYTAMKARCANPKDKQYFRYGGRGIIVCDRWAHSFEAFLEDMGLRPDPALTLERKDTNGPYSPDNCTWATWAQQFRNKRNNHFVTYQGQQVTVSEMSQLSGIGLSTLRYRLNNGITLDSAPRTGKNCRWALK